MQEDIEILIKKENVIIRTVDGVGSPIDIYNFKKGGLSKNETVFIDNILSMSKNLITLAEKKRADCKCKNCGCKDE